MKMNIGTIVTSMILGLIIASCNKQPIKTFTTKYSGQCIVHYEHQEINNTTGEITNIQWDSTYNDEIKVNIDYDQQLIHFKLTPQQHLCPNYQNEYDFKLVKDHYMYTINSNSIEEFRFDRNALVRNYTFWTGNGANYTLNQIDFKGFK
jgi:hypothetical protein